MINAHQTERMKQWVDSLMDRGKPAAAKNSILLKQRCVNIGGRDLFCVQDTASVQPHPLLLVGGLALLLWIVK